METKTTPKAAPATTKPASTLTVAEWAKKVGLTPKAARRQLRSGAIAGATKAAGEWDIPSTAKPAERKAKDVKPAKGAKAPKDVKPAAKAAKKITVKKTAKAGAEEQGPESLRELLKV